MEKRKPHYPLEEVKRLIRAGQWRITRTAAKTALRDFDLDMPGPILDVVLGLDLGGFYKSMTTLEDHRLWQDVYHAPVADGVAYVKVQIADDETVVISFKER